MELLRDMKGTIRGGAARIGAAMIVAGLAIGALAACASILDVDSDRSVAALDSSTAASDAASDGSSPGRPDVVEASGDADAGPAYQGAWACLNDPPETFQPGATTNVQVLSMDALQPFIAAQQVDGGSALDIVQYSPLPGYSMRACSSLLYPQCDNGSNSPWVTGDDAGTFSFTLPQSFAGFFQLGMGPPEAGLFTTTFFPAQFLAGQTTTVLPGEFLTLAETQALEVVLPTLPLSFDPDGGLGHLLMTVLDCNDQTASGVAVTPSAANPDGGTYPTTVFYSEGNGIQEVPTTMATETDNSGTAGIANIPVGELQVRVYLKATNQTLGTMDAFVVPGLAGFGFFRARTR